MNTIWECCKRKCKWTGTDAEKASIPHPKFDKPHFRVTLHVCPKCGCDGFYRTDEVANTTKAAP